MGRGLHLRYDHVPTWSIRADDPSRNYLLRPPRAPVPTWLRLLAQERRVEAALLISALSACTKALNRWVQFAVSLAALRRLALDEYRIEPGGGGRPEGSNAENRLDCPASGGDQREKEDQRGRSRGAGVAQRCGGGHGGEPGQIQMRGMMRAVSQVHLPTLRDALASQRGEAASKRNQGPVSFGTGATVRALAGASELGKAGA